MYPTRKLQNCLILLDIKLLDIKQSGGGFTTKLQDGVPKLMERGGGSKKMLAT